jgi:hypothetical protein
MSKLLSLEAPKRDEEGADVVFVRRVGRCKVRIKACSGPDGWHQWGAETSVLGDNVPAVEAWAEGVRNALDAG